MGAEDRPMSDEELAKGYREIEEVAQAMFTATADTAITVGEGHWDDLDPDVQRDLCKLAAAAIDRREQQRREQWERPTRVLICEAPEDFEGDLGDIAADYAIQGSLMLLADADEAYVFKGDKAAALKHRDRGVPSEVHVAIQRRSS